MNLDQIARDTRALTVRSIAQAGSGHPGGCLSAVDIMVLLHCEVMRPVYPGYHPNQFQDLFILSAGHKCPALYALWGVLGWVQPESVLTLRQLESPYQGHPSYQHISWNRTSTGSLGQGFATACGYALAYHRQGADRHVYCLIGDGEAQEGLVAETARIAAQEGLNNLTVIVDANGKASDRHSILQAGYPAKLFEASGWLVEGCNGHSWQELRACFALAQQVRTRPLAIVARTVKGWPVPGWTSDPDGAHGSLTLSEDDLKMALSAIEEN